MKKTIITGTLLCGLLFAGCQDLIDPAPDNFESKENMYDAPVYAEGLLMHAYIGFRGLSSNDWQFVFPDVATDNAVSNDPNDAFRRQANGEWTASNDATGIWTKYYNAIAYLNELIAAADQIEWAEDPEAAKLFRLRYLGEAYGMRAAFYYQLLRAHAGPVNDQLTGVQLFLEPVGQIPDLNFARADFATCVAQIYSDIKKAVEYLPMDYGDPLAQKDIDKYTAQGIKTTATYVRVLGTRFRGRMSGRIAMAVQAQLDLMAASPAFADGSGVTWEKAARSAAALLNANGGLGGLAKQGHTWYTNTDEINAIAEGSNPPEVIWMTRTFKHSGRTSMLEYNHYPPSLYGNGRLNPTQNLVDAFPMANGYPIDDENSGFDPAAPYQNRDPRLQLYVVYHGNTAGPFNAVISMETGNDAVARELTSTRTGYYMRKMLQQSTNVNPSSWNSTLSYQARMRYTEFYLAYAEAANEAWGPTADPDGNGYTAYDVIKAIRTRAGIGTNGEDPYLESVKKDREAMRELIRNERRLELCFEDFRFWDLRRWLVPLDKLNEPAMGITVSGGRISESVVVQQRLFESHMYYGPIPYNETLKFSELKQNDNW